MKREFDAAALMNDKYPTAKMLINPSSQIGKTALAFGCALLVQCTIGAAGESIQFSGANTPEKKAEQTSEEPKSDQPLTGFSSKIFRAYRPGETVSGSDFYKPKGTFPTPQPVVPPSSRQNQELLDRQRNWMFLTREDDKKSATADDAFGIEESSLTPRKGVIDRFLENKSSKPGLNVNSLAPTLDKNQLDPVGKTFSFGFENSSLNVEKPKQDRGVLNKSSLQPQFLDKNFVGGDSERSRMNDIWRNQFAPDATRFREQKREQMKEFEALFSQGASTPVGNGNGFGTVDSRSALSGGFSQSTVPSTRSADIFSSSAVANSSDPYKKLPTAVVGSSTLPPLDINSKVFGASAATPPAQSLEPVKPIAQPAILPFPKRRF